MFLYQDLKCLHKTHKQYVYLNVHLLQNIVLSHVPGGNAQLDLYFLKVLEFYKQ